jgi:hypothetical protein
MRTVLLTAVALVALVPGCVAESVGGPSVYHPTVTGTSPVVCSDASPTGSNIGRTVCREQPSPEEKALNTVWRDAFPESPFRGGSYATDTPGLRVYH